MNPQLMRGFGVFGLLKIHYKECTTMLQAFINELRGQLKEDRFIKHSISCHLVCVRTPLKRSSERASVLGA